MKRIITAALLLVLGAAQAMPVTPPRMKSLQAGASAPQTLAGKSRGDGDSDEDEAAPPVHIHRAHASNRKATPHKNTLRRPDDDAARRGATPFARPVPQNMPAADASLAQSGIKK